MQLHEILESHSADTMTRWRAKVSGTLVPESLDAIELTDHMPQFLSEIVSALREDAGKNSVEPVPEQSATAAEHGEQRLRLGFSLDSVVREYGALQEAIVDTAKAGAVEFSLHELQIVFNCTIVGIAHAVSEYTHQRNAELLRQGNEHFAFIAHELRNPLSTATLAFQLLNEQGHLPKNNRCVASLEKGIRRTSELVDQTLRTARVQSGVNLLREWTTLKEILDDVETGATPDADARGVTIHRGLEPNGKIKVDIRLVRSAVANVLRNGAKYTAPNSVVQLRATIANGRAVIEVEDCCGGVPEDKLQSMFAPFVRHASDQTGFGLGLAITKQAVDAHGGSVRVQNLPGKGCVFVLEIPVETADGSDGASASDIIPAQHG